ncbi:MAG: DNA mismatch repair endonuclease MutL [Planctomycetota bacterium]|jgi:DNA mismatch repair protein MutL
MPGIQVLSEAVRNRIAAGEVIERPASVVKELVENAIDAGSTAITVEVEDGGQSLIRVTDNGCGIPEDELSVAVLRHATSKIRDVEDIFHIASLGFRGEALPSIAAVSRLEMVSRTENQDHACSVVIEGGEIQRTQPSSGGVGTSITVQDLFYTTPARRKFLKSPRSEISVIHELITRLAIANPEIGFALSNGPKTVLRCAPCEEVIDRLASLFSPDLPGHLLPVEAAAAEQGITLSGFVGSPSETRANSKGIYLFMNRRWIKLPALNQVIRQSYEGVLPPRRYPITFLFLGVDPERVDVNVHPTKEEVRFRDERTVLGLIHRAVGMALRKEGSAPSIRGVAPPPSDSSSDSVPARTASPSQPDTPFTITREHTPEYTPNLPTPTSPPQTPRQHTIPSAAASPQPQVVQRALVDSRASTELTDERDPGASDYRVVAQVLDSFLVVEKSDGLVLIDQHALHERLIYEELLHRDREPVRQMLLVPASVELDASEWEAYEQVAEDLAQMGFGIEPFGEKTISLQAVPQVVKGVKAVSFLKECMAALAEGRTASDLREPLLRTIACKAAVKAGDRLPDGQVTALLERLEEGGIPSTCPHGRPFTFTLSLDELYRKFDRT